MVRNHGRVSDTGDNEYASPFKNNVRRLEKLIQSNGNNLTIERIRKGETITQDELKLLEKILFDENHSKTELEREMGHKLNLAQLIIGLVGMSRNMWKILYGFHQ